MAQYIDKSKVVAEIEKIKKEWTFFGKPGLGVVQALNDMLSFLDTLEVKEVDLEKEYEKYYEQERNIQTFKLAKYFFELGMQVSNKAQKGK